LCVFGGVDLGVVVEVDVDVSEGALACGFGAGVIAADDLSSARPGCDACSPLIERLIAISAGVEDFGAVETAVEEIGRDVHEERPLYGIGTDEGDVVAAEEGDEVWCDEAWMTDLHGVANGTLSGKRGVSAIFEAVVMVLGESGCCVGVAWKEGEELFEFGSVVLEVGWELPEDGAEFVTDS
jgi:hypothetical protein